MRPAIKGKSACLYLFPTVALIEEALGEKVDLSDKVHKAVTYFSVQEGVGDDVGYWLLTHNPDEGYAATLSRKSAYTLTMAIVANKLKHYVIDGDEHNPEDVEFAVDTERKEILFQVPSWIRFDPHSVYATVQSVRQPESPSNRLNRHQRRRLNKHGPRV